MGAASAFVRWLRARDRKYLAVEMEAAGLMAAGYKQAVAARTLVLRGVSDIADERKAALEDQSTGALRRYAVRNAIRLLWSLLDAGLLARHEAPAPEG